MYSRLALVVIASLAICLPFTRADDPPENGYARVLGVFRIPFEQFVAFFTFLAIEDG